MTKTESFVWGKKYGKSRVKTPPHHVGDDPGRIRAKTRTPAHVATSARVSLMQDYLCGEFIDAESSLFTNPLH